MLLFNLVRLTSRRISLLLLASVIAGGVGFSLARSAEATHSSTAIIFVSPIFRESRTDGELNNLVDDIILATELQSVTDAVGVDTGLEIDIDYTIETDRVIGGNDTIELVATAPSAEDAEAAALGTSQAALAFIVNQDMNQSESSQAAVATATAEILVRLSEIEDEAGGVSPIVLHDQAATELATLINLRGTATAATAAEAKVRNRVEAAQILRREYEQLEAQLEGLRSAEITEQGSNFASAAILSSLESKVVLKNSVANSSLPIVIQGVLVAVLATLGLALALFAMLDRKALAAPAQAAVAPLAPASRARSTTSDAAFSYDSSSSGASQSPQARAAAAPTAPRAKTSASASAATPQAKPAASRPAGQKAKQAQSPKTSASSNAPGAAKTRQAKASGAAQTVAKPAANVQAKAAPAKAAPTKATPATKAAPAQQAADKASTKSQNNGSTTTATKPNAKQATGPVKQTNANSRSKKKPGSKPTTPRSS